jgi:nucleotide-binding universal stress UspA family protein
MVNSSKKNGGSRMEIKRILVPTDFSEGSNKAEDQALFLAKMFKAKIILIHVIESSAYALDTSLIPPGDPFGLREKLVEMTEERVRLLKEKGGEAEGICVIGVPYVEIIKAVREYDADWVIMGTHGRRGLAHVLLGSTAERVIQRVQCPVLTVKADKKAAAEEEKKESLEGQRRMVEEMVPPGEKKAYCHLCGQVSHDIICDACKVRVQSEAFEMRQRVEKEGRVDTGRR